MKRGENGWRGEKIIGRKRTDRCAVKEEVEEPGRMVYYSGMEEKKPHWIHDEATDSTSVTGKKYLISCTCSECGYHANMEKPVCPQCKARMKD